MFSYIHFAPSKRRFLKALLIANGSFLLPLALICISPLRLPAQESRGNIAGRVTDSSGAAMPGTTVSVVNQGTNVSGRVQSNAQGEYQILLLNPGLYTITAEISGFKGFRAGPIELRVNDHLQVDIPLQLGDMSEKVEVTCSDEKNHYSGGGANREV
jgi:hypothetical protein